MRSLVAATGVVWALCLLWSPAAHAQAGDVAGGAVGDATGTVRDTQGDVADAVGDGTEAVGDTADAVDDTTDAVDGVVDDTTDAVDGVVDDTTDAVDGGAGAGTAPITDPVDDAVDGVTGSVGGTGGAGSDGQDGNTARSSEGINGGRRAASNSSELGVGGDPVAYADALLLGQRASKLGRAAKKADETGPTDPRGLSTPLDAFARAPSAPTDEAIGALEDARLERGGDRTTAIDTIVRNAAQVVTHVGFPMALALVVVGFLTLQNRVDREDPKLALAPVDQEGEVLHFE